MEFKVTRSAQEEVMKKAAQEAMSQIAGMHYADELAFSGIREVVHIAIVMHGKTVYMEHEVKSFC